MTPVLAEASVELAVGGPLYDVRHPRCWRSLRGHRDLNVLRLGERAGASARGASAASPQLLRFRAGGRCPAPSATNVGGEEHCVMARLWRSARWLLAGADLDQADNGARSTPLSSSSPHLHRHPSLRWCNCSLLTKSAWREPQPQPTPQLKACAAVYSGSQALDTCVVRALLEVDQASQVGAEHDTRGPAQRSALARSPPTEGRLYGERAT